MKGEFRDKDSHPPLPTTTIFSTLHHHHHQPPPPPPLFTTSHHHHHPTTTTSDESNTKKHSNPTTTTTNDGASIEVVRRPRGRPPGSRNKPKPQPPPPLNLTTTQPPHSSMSPYVLEVPGGLDIIAAVTRFCNHRYTALCVLSGSGAVSNVSFRQPTTTTTITFNGCFELLSISATVLPSSYPPPPTPFSDRFAVSLAAPQGQTIGGAVTGPLIAAGTVYIVAASFNNPLYHRLPMEEVEEEEDDRVRSSGGGGSVSGGGDGGSRRHAAPPSTAADYGCQPGSDVIWAPTPRQALPHSPLF